MSLRPRLALAVLVLLPACPSAGLSPLRPGIWRPASAPAGPVVALAYDAGSARLAAADAGSVWVGPARGRLEPVHRARGVHELRFAADGALWIAGEAGLERWRSGASSEALALGPGASAIHRIRRVGDRWLAAGSDGVHAGEPGGGWRRLELALPSGPVTALAAAPAEGGAKIGAVVAGVAHWVTWQEGAGVARHERIGTPGEGPRGAVDVWLGAGDDAGWTLLRDGCLVGPRRACPALPPGTEARRLLRADGRFWLVTGRGVWLADAPDGPWQRAEPPLASLASHDVAGADGALFVGTERGLWVAAAATEPARPAPWLPGHGAPVESARGAADGSLVPAAGSLADLPAALRDERRDPPIEAVRRAALAYLDLGGARLRGLRRGPERRGWLPTVALRLDHDRSRARSDDFDESFVSGGLRSLFDREDDRTRSFEASLSFAWDLGDVVYHPESVDVSREVRELVELRDDVLDEIHHLYFERRRVLLELLALPDGRPLEAARLRLRADELAAGIDAWTGGWFGRHAPSFAP